MNDKFFVGARSCGRFMSPVRETQSMREIRLLRWRLLHKGGGLTGMKSTINVFSFSFQSEYFIIKMFLRNSELTGTTMVQ